MQLRQASTIVNRVITISIAALLLLIFAAASFSQHSSNTPLPNKIRGYKVHDEILKFELPEASGSDAKRFLAKIDDPVLGDVSVSGLTFTINAEITSLEQSGTVNLISFKDFEIDGIPVSIDDLTEKFAFEKNEAAKLPKPAKIKLSSVGVVRTAWKELNESKKKWLITGRIFVFGKFRRFGFSFKRVVPVDVKIEIDNPLLDD